MKKVVVTGACGFIGGALTKKLLSSGVQVYGVDINAESLEKMKQYGDFIPVVADFSCYDKLPEMIKDDEIDVFYHFALKGGLESAAVRDYDLQLSNAKFACDALVLAKALNCQKFVFAGTANEFEIKTFINSEDFVPRYTCVYSAAKMAAELICKTYACNIGINYSAGLISLAYGEGNRSKQLINIVINQLIHNVSPKLIEGNNLYDLIYIDDIVDAFVAIGEKGRNMRSYYVGHRQLKTFKEILTEIGDTLNPNVDLLFGAFKDSSNLDYSLVDLNALYNDAGFECRSDFKESILKTAEWVKTLGWEA